MSTTRFWERKSLDDMSDEEWEALCDGCGQCCLHKLVNDETADVFYTRVACQLLDAGPAVHTLCATARGGRGLPRRAANALIRGRVDAATCAYRRLAEGKPLPGWHPLLTGDLNQW